MKRLGVLLLIGLLASGCATTKPDPDPCVFQPDDARRQMCYEVRNRSGHVASPAEQTANEIAWRAWQSFANEASRAISVFWYEILR